MSVSTATKPKRHLRGYSLSLCVRDILDGKVALDEVAMIVTGTRAVDDEDWAWLMKDYQRNYWRKHDPSKAIEIVSELRLSSRIYQPRLDDMDPPGRSKGIWGSVRPVPEITTDHVGEMIYDVLTEANHNSQAGGSILYNGLTMRIDAFESLVREGQDFSNLVLTLPTGEQFTIRVIRTG